MSIKYVCPYLNKCNDSENGSCVIVATANEKSIKGMPRLGRIDIVTCQANHGYIINVTEEK